VSANAGIASNDCGTFAGLLSARGPAVRRPTVLHDRSLDPVGADTITTAVFADEQAAADGVLGYLNASPDISVLPVSQHAEADVVLVLAGSVTDELLSEMDTISNRAVNVRQSMVLVSGPFRERHLARALRCGVVSILPRAETTPRLVARAVVASGNGRALLPETVARWLVDEARAFQQDVLAVHGLQAGGLADREVRVLKLLADGHDTGYIAEQLNYSERTIKKIIQDLMARLGLRNRAHAISYAFRAGVM
jgi:DNA-binding NarL/FixJ family response regulator